MSGLAISEVELTPNEPPGKTKVLIFSVLAGLMANIGIVSLLNSIHTDLPQNAPPLFAVTAPPKIMSATPPRPVLPDHSENRIISTNAISPLYASFSPFPDPPNPGKLERPLGHEHGASLIPCSFCDPLWSPVKVSLGFSPPESNTPYRR